MFNKQYLPDPHCVTDSEETTAVERGRLAGGGPGHNEEDSWTQTTEGSLRGVGGVEVGEGIRGLNGKNQ